jgi:valyl-tRNA synthetase
VKVTPAHDPNDFATGERHGLERINILDEQGRINEAGGAFAGQDRFAARKAVLAALAEKGLRRGEKTHRHAVGHCQRCGTVVEPYLSRQWFVKARPLAEPALAAVRSGEVRLIPEFWVATYENWLENILDWCISRQLWWGHRIPAFYCANGHTTVSEGDVSACGECGALVEQDPDVLDTWFSSALWPHSTLGWPQDSPELRKYYPGNVLSTAREIITLWVARMVLTGMYNLGKVPFHDVYIHAVIQDGQGRPFKKTLGNGFDPVDIIEVYGADALRYTMAAITTETQDIRMPMKKVKLDDGREMQTSTKYELGRNFCNKVWNAARFAFMTLTNDAESGTAAPLAKEPRASARAVLPKLKLSSLPVEDRWILSRVSRAVVEVQDALARFQFSRAVTLARDFFWDSLCDWYLEMVKSRVREDRQPAEARQVLAFALDQALRLLHPFIPFITERLWSQLNELTPRRGLPGLAELDCAKPLIISQYPPVDGWPALNDPTADAVFDDLQTATRAVRDIRQTRNVPPKQSVDVVIKAPPGRLESLRREADVVRHLANVGSLTVDADPPKPRNAATLVIGDLQIFVADVIDAAAERTRLEKDLTGLDKQIAGLAAKLSNADFTGRAPADLVQREQQRLAELRDKRETVVRTMKELD